MGFKKGEGGRPPGAKNKLTLARMQLRQEALRRLNEDLPEDAFDGDAIALFQRIYRDPNFDPELRLEAAAKIAAFERKDATPEAEPRYVAIMPLPVKDLNEWRRFTWRPSPMPARRTLPGMRRSPEYPLKTKRTGHLRRTMPHCQQKG